MGTYKICILCLKFESNSIFSDSLCGAGGYIYVGQLNEYKFKKEAPIGYKYIKSAMEHAKISDLTEDELRKLLEDIFLPDEQGKWYIPDVTKAADVLKLREKKLIKEFEEYLKITGKLKLFRTEAIRAGFAKLWKDKNYSLIVNTAERLPESVIQEDDKLLMYYDISLGRI